MSHYPQKVCLGHYIRCAVTDRIVDEDDELLLDAPDALLSESSDLQPIEGDTEMHIDEEGRPRFAPSKQVVCCA
jgi:hypothetical protein